MASILSLPQCVKVWLVQLIQSMYENARSSVHVGCNLSEEFSVKLSVHQGSCLSNYCSSLEELQEKLILWKANMEGKGLWVNMGKTKVLISGPGLDVLPKSGKDPCSMCLKGVGINSIFCGGCSSWFLPQEMQSHPWPSEIWCQLQV